jgi:hypothetical protein
MQKNKQICNFIFDSLQTSPFGGPLYLKTTSDQKIYKDKTFLEFNFREESLFYAKEKDLKKIYK